MNLRDFYSQREAFKILNIKYRQQIKRLKKREGFITMELCGKPFYLRRSVDKYMEDLIKKTGDINLRWEFEKKKLRVTHYDVDLDEWKPPCEILEMFPYSHEVLYAVSDLRTGFPMFRTKYLKSVRFFLVSDVLRYIEKGKKPLTTDNESPILET